MILKFSSASRPCQIADAVTALNKDLSDIARWCCMNSLLINPDKSKPLVTGVQQLMRTLPSIPPVKLLGKEIKSVTVVKGLGVIVDSSLSYNEYVTKTVSNCEHRLTVSTDLLLRSIELSTSLIERHYFY